jgi:hypothetical protein
MIRLHVLASRRVSSLVTLLLLYCRAPASKWPSCERLRAVARSWGPGPPPATKDRLRTSVGFVSGAVDAGGSLRTVGPGKRCSRLVPFEAPVAILRRRHRCRPDSPPSCENKPNHLFGQGAPNGTDRRDEKRAPRCWIVLPDASEEGLSVDARQINLGLAVNALSATGAGIRRATTPHQHGAGWGARVSLPCRLCERQRSGQDHLTRARGPERQHRRRLAQVFCCREQ